MYEKGTRVLICNAKEDYHFKPKYLKEVLEGTFVPKYGVVERSFLSEDRSYHGSPLYEPIMVVRGEDGKTYNDNNQGYSQKEFFTDSDFQKRVLIEISFIKEKKLEMIQTADQEIEKLEKGLTLFCDAIVHQKTKGSLEEKIENAGIKKGAEKKEKVTEKQSDKGICL